MSKKAELLESVLREMVTEEAVAARESLAGEIYNSPEFEKAVGTIVDATVESKVSDSFGSRSFKRDMESMISDVIDDVDITAMRGFQRAVEEVVDDYDFSDKIEDAIRDAIADHNFGDDVEEALEDYDFSGVIERVLEENEDKTNKLVAEALDQALISDDFQRRVDEAVSKALEAKTKAWREKMREEIEKFELLLAEIKEAIK